MVSLRVIGRVVVVSALLALAACSSTATQTTSFDSRTGTTQQVSGTLGFGSLFNPRYLGRWTMSDRFARSCTYEFLNEAMPGSSSIARAVKSGYCTPPFDDVSGWRATGSSLVLFDSSGDRLASLSLAGSNAYSGRFRGRTLSTDVIMRQGRV